VKSVLANAVLLRTDVTANDAEDQAFLERFGLFGPRPFSSSARTALSDLDSGSSGLWRPHRSACRPSEASTRWCLLGRAAWRRGGTLMMPDAERDQADRTERLPTVTAGVPFARIQRASP
jgi:hypothetical protein